MRASRSTVLALAFTVIGVAAGASGLVLAHGSPLMKSNEDNWTSKADVALADLGENDAYFRYTVQVAGQAKTDPSPRA